jgi:hypothetical protein
MQNRLQLTLESGAHNSNNNNNNGSDVAKLFETYHGVKINIDYSIAAELKRSGLLASSILTKEQVSIL